MNIFLLMFVLLLLYLSHHTFAPSAPPPLSLSFPLFISFRYYLATCVFSRLDPIRFLFLSPFISLSIPVHFLIRLFPSLTLCLSVLFSFFLNLYHLLFSFHILFVIYPPISYPIPPITSSSQSSASPPRSSQQHIRDFPKHFSFPASRAPRDERMALPTWLTSPKLPSQLPV